MNPRENLAVYRDLTLAELAACLEADAAGAERLAAYQAMDKRIANLLHPEPEWWLRTSFHQALRNQSTPQSFWANLSVTTGQVTAVLALGLLIIAAWLLLGQQSKNTMNPELAGTAVPPPSTCPISPTEQIWSGTGPMAGEFPVWMTSQGREAMTLLSTASGVPEQISAGVWGRSLLLVDEQFPDELIITGKQLDGQGEVYFFHRLEDDTITWEPQLLIPRANSSAIDGHPLGRVQHSIAWGVTEPGCYELTFSLNKYTTKIVIDVLPSPLITPTPTPDPQRVQLRLDSWSPDGQTLAYWQHTAADLERSHIPPGQLTFYNTSSGVTCSLPTTFGYDGGGGTHHRYAWRSDGSFLLFKGRDLLVLPNPCDEDHTTLADLFPENIQEVVAVHRYQAFYLLRGQSQYWLYQPFADSNLQILPIPGVTPHSFNAYAISPQGRYVGINLTGGGTAVIETATGQVKSTVDWSHLANVDMRPPVWLSEDSYLIQWTTADQGPLLVTLEGDIQPVAELFGVPASPQQMAWGVPTGPQAHTILFQDFSEGADRNQVRLYHSATGEVETLAFTGGEFDPNGRWLFLRQDQENTVDTLFQSNSTAAHHELWPREIEAVGSLALPLASDAEFIYWTTGPGPSDLVHTSKQLTISAGSRVLIVSETGDIQEEIVEGNITGAPLRSPDGHHLAVVVRSEETGADTLVVLPIE